MGDKVLKWSAWENIGVGIQNPGTVAVLPVTEEMLEAIRGKAEAEGLTPQEYLEREIDRANAELSGEGSP